MLLSLFLKQDAERQITETISELRAKERAKKKAKKKAKKTDKKEKSRVEQKDYYERSKVNKINPNRTLKQKKNFTKSKNYARIKGKKNKKQAKKGEVR